MQRQLDEIIQSTPPRMKRFTHASPRLVTPARRGLRAVLCASVWIASVCMGSASPAAASVPSPAQVRAAHQPSDTWVLAQDGTPLHRLRTNPTVRQGAWVPLHDMSHALRLALLASEDRRFYAHSGVDWQAVSAAAWGNVWNTKTRGASTLTMQLAGLLDEDLRLRSSSGGRSVRQKLGQAVAATQLERRWRKDEILEAYLNLVPLRGELVGIDALSRTLLGKAPHGLDVVEAAIAAALIRGPNAAADVVARRACGVLQDMAPLAGTALVMDAKADCVAAQWRTAQMLQARRWPASEGDAPHWARRAWRHAQAQGLPAGTALRTTLHAPVQRMAAGSLRRHLQELQGHGVEDGAVLVLDNASGHVLAWVGSSGSLSQAQEVDGVQALRQPGSTLKPFLYAQALQQQRLTAASLLHDAPAHLPTAAGLYVPQNYDRRFKGWVSVRTALAASLNVPAVRTLVMVTPDAFHTQLAQLGLHLPQPAGFYGYSLALGSPEVSLLALTNAYRALANGGQWRPVASPLWQGAAAPSTEAPRQALSPQAAFVVGSILSDAQARALTFGLDSVLSTRSWSAVKTGTSKDMRDNWAVGWSARYTVGVWVGNASGRAMHAVSGSSGAAPIWAEVMAALHVNVPSPPPTPPEGVVAQAVRFEAASQGAEVVEAARQEWFVQGTQQAVFQVPATQGRGQGPQAAEQARARILQPVDGTVLALDPDIPELQQRLRLQSSHDKVLWKVGGRTLGKGREMLWAPWPGRQLLQIYDESGRLLDEVALEVRGAYAKNR